MGPSCLRIRGLKMEGMPTKIPPSLYQNKKYQNNLSGQFIVFKSKIGMTIKSMSRLDLVLCLAEMISYMPDMVVS